VALPPATISRIAVAAPNANCTVRLVKDPITAPNAASFFVGVLLQMLHRMLLG